MNNDPKMIDTAIVGLGTLFPDACNVRQYWQNILNKKYSIKEIPDEYWDSNKFCNTDSDRDTSYNRVGGFIPDVEFNPLDFGIPPNQLEAISIEQLLSLIVANEALSDAGLIGANKKPFNKEKAGVILGAGIGNTAFSLATRLEIEDIRKILANNSIPENAIQGIVKDFKNARPEWNEDSFPGFLSNIVAGRIASRFDFYGTNFTVDAACASSFGAIKTAIYELQSNACDIVLTGGVTVDNSIFSYLCFCNTHALSQKNHSLPFNKDADGIILGSGIGLLVLKRLDDAIKNKDKIYAVIKGIGSSSDGLAKSIYAPNSDGQFLALKRAYAQSGVKPQDIELIEGHGTGTKAGDNCEVETLKRFFSQYQIKNQSIALGSVKSQIGHARLAAGASGLIKTALSLHHKILPPMLGGDSPNPDF